MNFYCKLHPDFEALNIGHLHDHVDRDHKEIYKGSLGHRDAFRQFFKDFVEADDQRRSDHRMVVRTWGRPPKMGQFVTDSEIEKK